MLSLPFKSLLSSIMYPFYLQPENLFSVRSTQPTTKIRLNPASTQNFTWQSPNLCLAYLSFQIEFKEAQTFINKINTRAITCVKKSNIKINNPQKRAITEVRIVKSSKCIKICSEIIRQSTAPLLEHIQVCSNTRYKEKINENHIQQKFTIFEQNKKSPNDSTSTYLMNSQLVLDDAWLPKKF